MSLVIANSEPRIYSYSEERDISLNDENLDDDTRYILEKYTRQGESISNYTEVCKDLAKQYAQYDEEKQYIDSMDFTICAHESDLPLLVRIMVRCYVQNDTMYKIVVNYFERIYNNMEMPFANIADMYFEPRPTRLPTLTPRSNANNAFIRSNRFILEDSYADVLDFSSLLPSIMQRYEESDVTNMRRNTMILPFNRRGIFDEGQITQLNLNSNPSIYELHRDIPPTAPTVQDLLLGERDLDVIMNPRRIPTRLTRNSNTEYEHRDEDEFGSDHSNFNTFEQFESFDEFAIYNHGLSDIEKHSKLVKIEDPKICIICINDFKVGKEFRVMTCTHEYCIDCADKWFAKCVRCPLCNHEFETNRCDPYRYDNEYSDMPDLISDDDSMPDLSDYEYTTEDEMELLFGFPYAEMEEDD